MLETESQNRKADTDERCDNIEKEEVCCLSVFALSEARC